VFSKSTVERILDRFPVARLGQLDDAGLAQALPFVFVRAAGALWSPIDGKPKKRAALDRIGWIENHPDVCILVDHYEADWTKLWWLKLFCDGRVIRGSHEHWSAAVGALAAKYPQYPDVPMFIGEPTMLRFEIKRWKSWAAQGDEALEAWLASEPT
jgi:PPOX class probable F420-dependent enzyme